MVCKRVLWAATAGPHLSVEVKVTHENGQPVSDGVVVDAAVQKDLLGELLFLLKLVGVPRQGRGTWMAVQTSLCKTVKNTNERSEWKSPGHNCYLWWNFQQKFFLNVLMYVTTTQVAWNNIIAPTRDSGLEIQQVEIQSCIYRGKEVKYQTHISLCSSSSVSLAKAFHW